MIAAANMATQITTMGQFSRLNRGFSNMGSFPFQPLAALRSRCATRARSRKRKP
jgi:hypothetical protein